MMALLRDRFYQEYKRHIRNGFYPIRDREVMRDIYEQYHALGGNGVITHLKEELDELPTYPPGQQSEKRHAILARIACRFSCYLG